MIEVEKVIKTKYKWIITLSSEEAKDLLISAKILVERNEQFDTGQFLAKTSRMICDKFKDKDPMRCWLEEKEQENVHRF